MKTIKFICIPICLAIVAYLSFQWIVYFKEIASSDASAFIGFLSYVGGYFLVLCVLVIIGWGVHRLQLILSIQMEIQVDQLVTWTLYLILYLAFWWIVRATLSAEEEFVPENMLLAGAGLAVVIISKKLFEASQQRQLQLTYENDRQEAELSLLKAQVNPHFLFNALNTLYNDALKVGAVQMTTHLEMLTDILRYQLQYASRQVISLEEELNFIRQFVDFQKHRFQSDASVDISIEMAIDRSEYVIHPMILIAFIENAFKHGISRENPSQVVVKMTQDQNLLQLMVRNTNFPKEERKMSSGIGLAQVSKLLVAQYPDHRYMVEADDEKYQVTLNLNLEVNE